MIKTDGYFLLHRSLFENPIVTKDADYFITWIYILSQAEWKSGKKVEFGGKTIELQAGQFTTGVSNQMLSDLKKVNNGLNVSKLNRVLKKLKIEKQIEQRSDHQCTLITVLNWDKYQLSEQRNEQRVNNDRTTNEQRVNTNEIKEEENERNKGIKELSNDNSSLKASGEDERKPYQEYIDLWNSLKNLGIQPIRSISGKRLISFRARLKEHGKDSFTECIEQIRQSEFLQKSNFFKFDWIVCETNYPKVLEGKYSDKAKQKQSSFDADEFLRRFEE